MQFTKTKKATAVLGAAAVVVAGAGAAYAYWTTAGGGTGSGSTSAGDASAFTVHQDDPISAMFPGDTAQTIHFTVKNTGSANYSLKSVTVKVSSVTVSDGHGGQVTAPSCDYSDFELDSAQATTSGVTENVKSDGTELDLVPAGGGTTPATGSTVQSSFKIGFHNKASLQDGCKAATVNLSYTTNS